MLEVLLGSVTEPSTPSKDNTDYQRLRRLYGRNVRYGINGVPANSGPCYIAVYNSKIYLCSNTVITVFDILNNFNVVGTIEYPGIKPVFGIRGSQYVVDNHLYCGADDLDSASGGGIWDINILTGDVIKYAFNPQVGAILVIDRILYVIGQNTGLYTRYDLDKNTFNSIAYANGADTIRIVGGSMFPYGDGWYMLAGGGNGFGGSDGNNYNALWMFNPTLNQAVVRATTTSPIQSKYHNPVMLYRNYLYQLAPFSTGTTSYKHDTTNGTSTALVSTAKVGGDQTVFDGKEGVLFMHSLNKTTIELIIVD